ncbi:MAG: hypothetical protein WDZ41_02275 [Candidatus Babeliales bacterium]
MIFWKKIKEQFIPADVPAAKKYDFAKNYQAITRGTNHLMLFSCDQKIEHMNDDFYGPDIPVEDNNPEHLFEIASKGDIGAMAIQLGLLARYGNQYKNIDYIVKLNSKTNLVKEEIKDPFSKQLWTVKDVVKFQKHTNLKIRGIGFTLYLGSEFEAEMLHTAAKMVFEAHQHGLITILWMYPRGKSITNQLDGNLIAGAAGVANALGSDFAKINPPKSSDNKTSEKWLAIAAQTAGNTKLLCSGGATIDDEKFLQKLYNQIHVGNIAGNATGRNIHQKTLGHAIAFTQAIAAIVYENQNIEKAISLLKK